MKVIVAGQGSVGLPLAIRAAEVGHLATGCDVDGHRIERFNSGDSSVEDVAPRGCTRSWTAVAYRAGADPGVQVGFDLAVITVPTRLRRRPRPGLR